MKQKGKITISKMEKSSWKKKEKLFQRLVFGRVKNRKEKLLDQIQKLYFGSTKVDKCIISTLAVR